MTPEEIKQWIWSRCHEDGDCVLWDGAVAKSGVATARDPWTEGTAPVRRTLLKAMGVSIEGKVATTTCNHPLCMAEGHVVAWTRKQLQKRSGKKLSVDLVRSAKMAEIARRNSSLTMERVREIRASGLRPKQAAEAFDIPFQTAARIIRHAAWKDYGSNPFSGLGARG